MPIWSVPVSPPLSVAVAVTVCVPTDNTTLNVAPAPMVPLRLETQDRLALRSPSSRSVAHPVKGISSPWAKVEPSAGAVMVTVGTRLAGVSLYSTCSSGAAAETPSYASAVRSPIPLMMITTELPLVHPDRSTISWMTGAISDVR